MKQPMDWRLEADYAYCQQLDLSGWAWQFLRRNPAYQADYIEFINLWRQLEEVYGAPPNRDFFKWKQDPRAWRPEADITACGNEVCPGENDQVLIECWLGAKWGFRKFPIDPAIPLPDALSWREFPIQIEAIEEGFFTPSPDTLALIFDLALPLPVQLEAAKHRLIAASNGRARSGQLAPRNLREGAPIWLAQLRILDALDTGASLSQIAQAPGLNPDEKEVETVSKAALAMRDGGYRRLLMLQPTPRD
jgi:hypothetical protein